MSDIYKEQDVKVAILAGGMGTRLVEETDIRPKPMVEIGGRPILWHIMQYYSHFGFNDFVIALGYKGEAVKRYMLDYCLLSRDLKLDFTTGEVARHGGVVPPWTMDLVDTGGLTATGGRIKRLAPYIGDSTFMLTWCDGLSDVNLHELLAFHRSHGKLATLTAVRPPARFGSVSLKRGQVERFVEKPEGGEGWVNGAFFVLEPGVLDYIDGDEISWEKEPLERLALDGQLMAYEHTSFWQCMDTLKDKLLLEQLWKSGECPWKFWE